MIRSAIGGALATSRSTCSMVGPVVRGGYSRMCRLLNCLTGLASMKSHETAHEQRQLRVARSRRTVAALVPAFMRSLRRDGGTGGAHRVEGRGSMRGEAHRDLRATGCGVIR
jgi:hypothetical protein